VVVGVAMTDGEIVILAFILAASHMVLIWFISRSEAKMMREMQWAMRQVEDMRRIVLTVREEWFLKGLSEAQRIAERSDEPGDAGE
jgi:hypothetical protein